MATMQTVTNSIGLKQAELHGNNADCDQFHTTQAGQAESHGNNADCGPFHMTQAR